MTKVGIGANLISLILLKIDGNKGS